MFIYGLSMFESTVNFSVFEFFAVLTNEGQKLVEVCALFMVYDENMNCDGFIRNFQ